MDANIQGQKVTFSWSTAPNIHTLPNLYKSLGLSCIQAGSILYSMGDPYGFLKTVSQIPNIIFNDPWCSDMAQVYIKI